jgi:hypothetical protein
MAENADVDFEIDSADMTYLDDLSDTATEDHGPQRS